MRAQYISQDSATVMVNRLPPPPLLPFVANEAPHLVHLSRVDWLDDDVHGWWHEVPYDRLIHVLPLWFFFLMSQSRSSDSLSTHVPYPECHFRSVPSRQSGFLRPVKIPSWYIPAELFVADKQDFDTENAVFHQAFCHIFPHQSSDT
jgi:hypothetical protein